MAIQNIFVLSQINLSMQSFTLSYDFLPSSIIICSDRNLAKTVEYHEETNFNENKNPIKFSKIILWILVYAVYNSANLIIE